MEARARRLEEKLKKEGGTPFTGFHLLCAIGDAAHVKQAIADGADVNAGDPDHGMTPPLAIAAGNNPDPGVIEALLEAGADIDFSGKTYRRTAMHMSVLFNPDPVPVAKALLKGKPTFEKMDAGDETALGYAIKGATVENNFFSGIPNDDLVAVIVDAGASATVGGTDERHRQFFSFFLGEYLEAFETHARDAYPSIAVLAAFQKANADFNHVARSSRYGTVLNMCVARNPGNTGAVELMLAAGADPNLHGPSGIVPLHIAANNADVATIRALLLAGAKIGAVDEDGAGVLHYAFKGHSGDAMALEETLNVLLDAGVDANSLNDDKQTPLFYFARWTNIESDDAVDAHLPVMRGFIERGADLGARDERGNSLIHEADSTTAMSAPKMKLMLALGCDINDRGYNGMTLLMQRAYTYNSLIGRIAWNRTQGKPESEERYYIDAFTSLMEMGADPSLVDNDGKTAADYLSEQARKVLLENPVGKLIIPPGS